MCGISGIIYQQGPPDQDEIQKMNDAILHRGPDGEGIFEGTNFLLGHRRLSIIDLSEHGNQPMHYFKNRYTIVFNGEIFNYLEIKETLQVEGFNFATTSDTEVVMAAYHRWGLDCLNHLNGMWSFALYDSEKQEIICARDRYAIKPFIYSKAKDRFIFGSELKQFLRVPGFNRSVHTENISIFLSKGRLNQSETTLLKEVFELPGGHFLRYDLNHHKIEVKRWYNLIGRTPLKTHISEEEAIETVREKFFKSIKIRMRSDVQVGALLSGGIDSSSIVCAAKHLGFEPVTLSSCFKGDDYDETPYIDAVIQKTGLKNIKSYPSLKDWLTPARLEKFIFAQDQPVTGLSHIAEFNIYAEVQKAGLKVVLDGQGSDEYLAGYMGFFPTFYLNLAKTVRWYRLFREMEFRNRNHNVSPQESLKEIIRHGIPSSVREPIRKWTGNPRIPKWLHLDRLLDTNLGRIKRGATQHYFSSIHALSQHEIQHSIPYLVHSADRSSMAHSVEARLPFLDFELLEYVLSLPDHFKIRDGTTKYPIRKALNSILPEKVLNRHPKMGFVTPEDLFFRENPQYVSDVLDQSVKKTYGLISPEIVSTYRKDQAAGRFDRAYVRCMVFAIWLDQFDLSI